MSSEPERIEYSRENAEKVAEALVKKMSLDQLSSYVYDNLFDHIRHDATAFDDAVETLNKNELEQNKIL